MRAIMQRRYGAPDEVLAVDDVARPEPGEDQVLVRVHTASINAVDWHRVRGTPVVMRATDGLRRPREATPGSDFAGVVEAVGTGVTDLRPGDEVFGARTGSLAEYVAARVVAPKPSGLTFEEAAAIPVAGLTALQAVRVHGRVRPGQRVLVNGAGGGVGTLALQIAKADGAETTAVTRTEHVELVRALGADHVVDYRITDFTTQDARYDVIIDVGGTPVLRRQRRALAPGGTLVIVGAAKGRGGPILAAMVALVRKHVLRQRVIVFIAKTRKEDLLALRELVEAGSLRPVVDRVYALDDAATALLEVEREHIGGKVVVRVRDA